jgi:hypothetical protein
MERKVKSLQIAFSAIIILAFLAMPYSTYAQGGKANFTGSWTYNAEKSNMGQPPQGQGQPPQGQGQGQGQRMGGFGGGNLAVKQEANLLTVDRTRTGQDGQPTTTTEKYTLDGKESVNTNARGESKSTAVWSADGKSLTIKTTRSFNGNDMTTTAAWTIDGAALVITSTMNTPNGERTTKTVYDKK